MTEQPGDWLAPEPERNGCATVLGTRAAWVIPKRKYPQAVGKDITGQTTEAAADSLIRLWLSLPQGKPKPECCCTASAKGP
jgi:hypothetical protein